MANMRFSELTTASALAESDILAISKANGESASGYMSFKATMIAIAIYITKLATYSSDLDTTDKHIIGAINELKRLISVIPTFSVEVVETLPTEDISETTLYLTPSQNPETENAYDEFIYVNNEWEQVGSTAVDLSAYYTKLETDALLATKANAAEVAASLALKENKSDMQNDVKEIIESCYEEKTVTGNPITIKTISGSNAKALTVSMNPIQDLHGYSNPWAGGAGKNKLPFDIAELKANNTNGTWSGNSYDFRGVLYSCDNKGIWTVTGSATDTSYLRIFNDELSAGSYVLNGISGGSSSTYRLRYKIGSGSFVNMYDGDSATINVSTSDTVTIDLYISSGYQIPTGGITFEPMIRLSSVADSTFEPYENICPISGRTEVSITRTVGEDVETKTHQYSETVYGGSDDFVNGGATSTYYMYEPTEITQAAISSQTETVVVFDLTLSMNSLPTPKTPTSIISNRFSTTIPSGQAGRMVLSTTHLYLVINKSELDSTDLAGLNAWISDNPSQFCYELATPTTIETSAEEITLLKGNNVLSTNADNMELSYQEIPDITSLAQYVQTLEARIKALEEAE